MPRPTMIVSLLLLAACAAAQAGDVLFADRFPRSQTFDPANATSTYGYFFMNPPPSTPPYQRVTGALRASVSPFTLSVAQGAMGALDHVKLLIYHRAPFAAAPQAGKPVLRYSLSAAVQTFKSGSHPFPAGFVTRSKDDLRLGACALIAADLQNGMVTDFFVTNRGVYAYYERLPFMRSATDVYRSFSQTKRVADRMPEDVNDLTVEYDSQRGTLSWFVKKQRVLHVNKIGFLSTDPDIVTLIDVGGKETLVTSFSPNVGFGCFTLLDAIDFWNPAANVGLVRLNSGDSYYTTPKTFYDNVSLDSNRLWQQGAQIDLKSFKVEVDGKSLRKD